jgi:DNA replication protein DnaC
MIDRLVHHAESVSLKGHSYRLRDRKLIGSKAKVATTLDAE